MKTLKIVVAAGLGALALGASAQPPCPQADAAKAQKAIDRVNGWEDLYRAFRDFGHCDDGETGELFTDAMLRLMVDWRDVEGLAGPMQKDAKYKAFIERHLLSSMAKPDHPSVYSRAKADCPAGQEAFCAGLAELVKPIQ